MRSSRLFCSRGVPNAVATKQTSNYGMIFFDVFSGADGGQKFPFVEPVRDMREHGSAYQCQIDRTLISGICEGFSEEGGLVCKDAMMKDELGGARQHGH